MYYNQELKNALENILHHLADNESELDDRHHSNACSNARRKEIASGKDASCSCHIAQGWKAWANAQ